MPVLLIVIACLQIAVFLLAAATSSNALNSILSANGYHFSIILLALGYIALLLRRIHWDIDEQKRLQRRAVDALTAPPLEPTQAARPVLAACPNCRRPIGAEDVICECGMKLS
ncbi:hypothetical protein [Rhizobium sp. G21]|uniref:hypothetical protein n=1 Tax=Rhizobium sp. G21 TaxID=2758439 RepID=UPI001603D651|nr:hypothetical protein [Rhizobium sp. G21]MBB1247432.1 hypothetical protein [Rhizobium sp. G21]